MEKTLSGIDSIVVFQNSQGINGRGTLVHITRRTIVFEVYNPFSIVQASEVLKNIRVLRGDRVIYNGKAVINNLVATGLMVIVSATLLDSWSDLTGLKPGGGLKEETSRFVSDWESSNEIIMPGYQLIVSSMSNFLGEFSRWLEQAEVESIGEAPSELQNEFCSEVQDSVESKIIGLFSDFEEIADKIPPEEETSHKAFAQRELHPYILCSPFVHRSYSKPLGYAGDYEMVNMMLRESTAKPSSVYAKIVDNFHISRAAPEAHRNRIDMLGERLVQEAQRANSEEKLFTVLNVGCGPALEVQRYIRNEDISNQTVFHLMDFNEETISYSEDKITRAIRESGNTPTVKFVRKSVDELLKEVYEKETMIQSTYEMVYCAGLFDYFSHQVCKKLVALFANWVKPGGLLTVTNVHPDNPNRNLMEHLLDWYLFYRNENDMASLSPEGMKYEISLDKTGVNVFLDIRK